MKKILYSQRFLKVQDNMDDYKSIFYDTYGDKEDQWMAFEAEYHPLVSMKRVLTSERDLTRIEQTVKHCYWDIGGFEDDIDEEGWHHFTAPFKHFTAEYWQRTNLTQITLDEELVEEANLEDREYTFMNMFWRKDSELESLDYDLEIYLMVKRWFEMNKPQDDVAYRTIVGYLKPFKDHISYDIHFDKPDHCIVKLSPKKLDYSSGDTYANIFYKTCLSNLKSALSLLLMKQLMMTKENMIKLKDREEIILQLVEKAH